MLNHMVQHVTHGLAACKGGPSRNRRHLHCDGQRPGAVAGVRHRKVKGNLDFFGDPAAINAALNIDRADKFPKIYPSREPDTEQFSETDIAVLSDAIAFCKDKSSGYLSNLVHNEEAWLSAARDAEMSLELLVPEDQREEVREAAACVVL
jgi:hypothetical protein